MVKTKPEAIYPTMDKKVVTRAEDGKSVTTTETVPNFSKVPENQKAIDKWEDINNKGRGSIMLHLHPVIAEKYYAMELALEVWQSLEKEYGKPGIAAIYQEFRGAMETVIPGNSNPSLALDNIITRFSCMAASQYAIPDHLQVMIIISKLPPIMGPLVQAVCQTDDIKSLILDKVRWAIILGWEQRSSARYNHPSHQPQAARKLSAIQHSGPPPSFQQQQQQPQQEEQGQNHGQSNQNSQRGGWCGGCGG